MIRGLKCNENIRVVVTKKLAANFFGILRRSSRSDELNQLLNMLH